MKPTFYIELALIGAAFGAPALAAALYFVHRRWGGLKVWTRRGLAAGLALAALGYGCAVYATLIEPKQLVVRDYDVASAHWRGPPLTIAALGDLHIGSPHVPPERVATIVARVNALNPDLVVLLGDYVPGHAPWETRDAREVERIEAGIAALSAIEGEKFAVIGNHDFWYGRERVSAALEAAGFAVLWDQNAPMTQHGGAYFVVGLEDDWTGAPDFEVARAGVSADAASIVIAHSPDPYADAPAGAGVYLAAHTHCGQVSIPFLGRPILPIRHRRFACGRVDENDKAIIVTGGVGTSGPPVRFLNPPEIALITLRERAK